MINLQRPRPKIIDTTLRDGQQSPILHDCGKHMLSLDERMELAIALMEIGVRHFEVFAPNVGRMEKLQIKRLIIARDAFTARTGKQVQVFAHVRVHTDDVDSALAIRGINGLNMYMGTSHQSQQYNHHRTLEQVARTARDLLAQVRKQYPDIILRFSGEDAFRTSIEDLKIVYDTVKDYVDRLGTPDTVGTARPHEVAQRVAQLRTLYPTIALEGHFHADLGYERINAVTAIRAGMEFIQTTIMGFAERTGITSLTGLLFNLYHENPNLVQDYVIGQSYALNVLYASMLGIQVPTHESVSGTSRTHSAGLHGQAQMNSATVYEGHDFTAFGVDKSRLLLGALSGWHIIRYYLTNFLYFEKVDEATARAITKVFKDRSIEINRKFSPSDLLGNIAKQFGLNRQDSHPNTHIELV